MNNGGKKVWQKAFALYTASKSKTKSIDQSFLDMPLQSKKKNTDVSPLHI